MAKVTGLIYTPEGRAREYSRLACNVYSGDCAHLCAYCYVKGLNRRFGRSGPPAVRSNDFLGSLERQAARLQSAGIGGRVLLCFTTDPYQPINDAAGITRGTIEILHHYGFTIQVLTKGGRRALGDLDMFGPGDAFASTLTFIEPEDSRRWEPGAALPDERIETLRRFHEAGVETWVSLEPVLNVPQTLEIIRRTAGFVNLFKVGKLNHTASLPENLRDEVRGIDWQNFAFRAVRLLNQLNARYYIKDDLREYLPSHLITVQNSTPPDDLYHEPPAPVQKPPEQLTLL